MEVVTDFVFLGSKISVDGDCSHEIRRWLLLGRKAMTNLDSLYPFSSVAWSCLTLCNLVDCSPPSSSVHEMFQARILEWIAIFFSRISSQLRDWTHVSCGSCMVAGFFTTELQGSPYMYTKMFNAKICFQILIFLSFYIWGIKGLKIRMIFSNKKFFIVSGKGKTRPLTWSGIWGVVSSCLTVPKSVLSIYWWIASSGKAILRTKR